MTGKTGRVGRLVACSQKCIPALSRPSVNLGSKLVAIACNNDSTVFLEDFDGIGRSVVELKYFCEKWIGNYRAHNGC